MGPFVGADEGGDMTEQLIIPFRRGVDKIVDSLENADFAKEIYLSHGERGFHGAAARGAGEPVSKFERVIAAGQQSAVADFGMTRFIPSDAGEVILGFE